MENENKNTETAEDSNPAKPEELRALQKKIRDRVVKLREEAKASDQKDITPSGENTGS